MRKSNWLDQRIHLEFIEYYNRTMAKAFRGRYNP